MPRLRQTTLAFSLLEALAAMGLIAGVAVVTYAIFAPAWGSGQASGEVARLEKLRHVVPGFYASSPNFQGVNADPGLTPMSGPSPWGAFSLSGAMINTANDGWAAHYTQVPTKACIELINAEAGREWTSISVDSTVIANAPQGLNQCETSDAHAMTFTMYGGLRGMNGVGVLLPPGFPPREPAPPGMPTPPVIPIAPSSPAPPGGTTPPRGGAPTPAPSPAPPGTPIPAPPPLPPDPVYPPACSPPAPQQQPVACPAGEISSVPPYSANGITDQRDASCPWRYAVPVWGSWYAIANTCAPVCAAPPAQTQAVACPSGQISSVSPYSANGVTQRRTASCPAPTGAYVWSAWSNISSTCAPVCTSPPTSSFQNDQWLTANPGCPSGQVGTYSYQYEQAQTVTTTWHCAAPTGSATPSTSTGGWTNTGATRDVVNTCAPAIPPPASYTGGEVCGTIGVNIVQQCAAGAGLSVFESPNVWTGGSYSLTITYNGSSQAVTAYTGQYGATTTNFTVGGGTFAVTVNAGITDNCPQANPAFAGSCIARVQGSVSGP